MSALVRRGVRFQTLHACQLFFVSELLDQVTVFSVSIAITVVSIFFSIHPYIPPPHYIPVISIFFAIIPYIIVNVTEIPCLLHCHHANMLQQNQKKGNVSQQLCVSMENHVS